jgi:hypothetical protein
MRSLPGQSKETVIVPHRLSASGGVDPVVKVRSTLLASSLMSLRERGWLDAYTKALPAALHPTILNAVPGHWLDVDIAMAHYEACDRLRRSPEEQFEIGWRVADRIQNSVLGTLVRVATGAGVTPWTGLAYFQRLWDRLMVGGSGAVFRIGPKEARVEIRGVPMVQFDWFRNGWRGMFGGSGQLFANKLYIHEVPRQTTKMATAFRMSWA